MERATETTVNKFGLVIKKCCASCQHRDFDDLERRCCLLKGKHVRGNCVCENWSMNVGLNTLGCNRGKVQRRSYQLSLMEIRISEAETNARGKEVEPASVESIRRDFEAVHGSRYLLH